MNLAWRLLGFTLEESGSQGLCSHDEVLYKPCWAAQRWDLPRVPVCTLDTGWGQRRLWHHFHSPPTPAGAHYSSEPDYFFCVLLSDMCSTRKNHVQKWHLMHLLVPTLPTKESVHTGTLDLPISCPESVAFLYIHS